MTTRRDMMKTMALSAFALPVLTQKSWAAQLSGMNELREGFEIPSIPGADDPDFWSKVLSGKKEG